MSCSQIARSIAMIIVCLCLSRMQVLFFKFEYDDATTTAAAV